MLWYCYNCKKELGDGLWEGLNWDGQDEEDKDFDKKREIILDKLKQSLGGNVTINTPFSELPEKYQNDPHTIKQSIESYKFLYLHEKEHPYK